MCRIIETSPPGIADVTRPGTFIVRITFGEAVFIAHTFMQIRQHCHIAGAHRLRNAVEQRHF
ncbi:hypothetical protein D3C87_1540160 [compost metagenome]